jgi:hypothetical protein
LHHIIESGQFCIELSVKDGVAAQYELNSRFECKLIETEVSEESREAELKDLLDLLVAEDEDLERRALDRVVSQVVSKQFQASLRL